MDDWKARDEIFSTTNAAGMLALVALLLCTGIASCGASEEPQRTAQRPNLVLIVVDTLRSDRLGCYGLDGAASPQIDALARAGTLFEWAQAPSSWTRPSTASLFTSLWPSEHGATTVGRPLPPSLPTLAEELRSAGYATIGVSANFVHVNEAAGLSRGFGTWISRAVPTERADAEGLWHDDDASGRPATFRAMNAREVNAELIRALPEASTQPLFLYLHYMEPHAPYSSADGSEAVSNRRIVDLGRGQIAVGEEERARIVSLYDSEVRRVDAAIGALLSSLRERGLLEKSVVVLTSDHGEEFGEHGRWSHGLALHAESLRVPMIFRGLGIPEGERRSEAVGLLDVPTTLLQLAGVPAADGMRGRNLFASEPSAARDQLAQLHPDPVLEERAGERLQRLALTRWPWKAIVDREEMVVSFDLRADPAERSPLAASAAPPSLVEDALRLRRGMQTDAGSTRAGPPIDGATRERLRALGYAE